MKIDFVSDVACPWCAVGLNSLERALERIGGGIPVELHFRPFELNPQMAPEGEDAAEHLRRKYALTPEQLERNRAHLRERGAAVGFEFGERQRVWNTFDAHRLLHWAGIVGYQRELKHALLQAYQGRGENPGDHEVLAQAAAQAGLDAAQARDVLASGRYADEVRAEERHWQELGISSVPSVVVDGQYLIQGGQPPEVFEQALRQIATAAAA
jgi:predicted DsbA family dithiol-disulfide isomerase